MAVASCSMPPWQDWPRALGRGGQKQTWPLHIAADEDTTNTAAPVSRPEARSNVTARRRRRLFITTIRKRPILSHSRGGHDLVDLAVLVDDVHLALVVPSERGRGVEAAPEGGRPVAAIHGLAAPHAEGPDEGRAVVGIEISPRIARQPAAAVHDPTRDRATLAVGVIEDGQCQPGLIASAGGLEAAGPFHDVPAVVLASAAGRGREVHLPAPVLPDSRAKNAPHPPADTQPPPL